MLSRLLTTLVVLAVLSRAALAEEWKNITPAVPGVISATAATASDRNVLFTIVAGRLLRTRNRGVSWEQVGPGTVFFSDVAIDPHNSRHVIASGAFSSVVYTSTDTGDTWSGGLVKAAGLLAMGADSTTIYMGVAQGCGIFGCSDGGVVRSSDGGTTWTGAGLGDQTIVVITADPLNANVVYAMGYNALTHPAGNDLLFRTRDGGRTWTTLNTAVNVNPVSSRNRTSLLIDPVVPSNLFLATDAGLFASSNAGDTWRLLRADWPFSALTALALQSSTIYAAGPPLSTSTPPPLPLPIPLPVPTLYGLMRSADQGATWSRFLDNGTPAGTTQLVVYDTAFMIATGTGGIYVNQPVTPRRRAVRP